MSRIGKLPIEISDSVKVSINDRDITLNAGDIKESYRLSSGVKAEFKDKKIIVSAIDDSVPRISMFVGMNRSNIQNIVSGLLTPFKIVLEINGVGYKASVNNRILALTLGYSHEIFYALPDNIEAKFEKPNRVIITGRSKILVGQVAAEIIAFRKPEPYKGKGVKISGQKILRKEGKKK